MVFGKLGNHTSVKADKEAKAATDKAVADKFGLKHLIDRYGLLD